MWVEAIRDHYKVSNKAIIVQQMEARETIKNYELPKVKVQF